MQPLALPVTIETLWTAAQMALGFLAVMFAGARFLPGIERVGYPQPDGTRKRYTLTGMTLFFLANVALGGVVVGKALGFDVSLTPIAQHFWPLLIVALALSTLITLVLLAWGRRAGPVCRSPESTSLPLPEAVKEFWFGNECNPELFGVDLKLFFYQPSLIGAYLVNVSFAFAQWERHGFVTPQLLCLCFFWFTYLFSHYVKEEFMLSTWDVLAENFGFMLVWGDLTYVPFLYSLPGWWMVDATEPLATTTLLVLIAAGVLALLPDQWLQRVLRGRSTPVPAAASAATPAVTAPAASAIVVQDPPAMIATEAASAALPPLPWISPSTTPAAGAALILKSSSESWVDVQDANGQTLLSRRLAAGESASVDGAMPLRLTIGNAAATQVIFRGKPVDLSLNIRDNVARIQLN